MHVGSRRTNQPATIFVEGEPELQPPEELAVGVLDETALARDDVDCELVDDADVDTDVAEDAFDDMVHAADEDADDPVWSPEEFLCHGCFQVMHRHHLLDPSGPLCRQCCG